VAPIPVVRGTLDLLVLKTLSWGPMHSLEIITWVEGQSAGRLNIDDSALLQAFHRMEERRLVTSSWGQTANKRRARYYRITPKGQTYLADETARLNEYNETLNAILEIRAAERPA
jgi:DNA-binding PadR family transcriptional regulator